MLISLFTVLAVSQIATPQHVDFAKDEDGTVFMDDVVYTPVDNPTGLCVATYKFVEQVTHAFTETPEYEAATSTPEYVAMEKVITAQEEAGCVPGLGSMPDDSPDCASLRDDLQQAFDQVKRTPEFAAVNALPHITRARDAVLAGTEDGCYTL